MEMQEKVVFVTCDDDDKVAEIKELNGKYVRLAMCLLCQTKFGLVRVCCVVQNLALYVFVVLCKIWPCQYAFFLPCNIIHYVHHSALQLF